MHLHLRKRNVCALLTHCCVSLCVVEQATFCSWLISPRRFWGIASPDGRHSLSRRTACASETDVSYPGTAADMVQAGVPAEFAASIVELSSAVSAKNTEPVSDPLTLLRFFFSSSQDVDKAAAMYHQAVAWRSEYSICPVMERHGDAGQYHADGCRRTDVANWIWRRNPGASPEAALAQRHCFFGRLGRTAPDGGPVMVWRLGQADWAGYERENLFDTLMPALAAHFEDSFQAVRAASLRRGALVSARLVVDARGVKFSVVRCIKFFRIVVDIIAPHYPEMFTSVSVIRAPGFVTALWPMIRPIVPPKAQGKVAFFGEDYASNLLAHAGIDQSILPKSLGGDAEDDEVCEAAPVPVGIQI
eukprot:TRINITY_DN59133_c0_g1_i1.p1 TRINITY_DN59133_c0_g1~~TRINITY_DN59133_c0_g1_i1.p1  ORF type:complete len:360 (-),score=48.34 TRINITY_DN59133_c0_g1_i1:76-1155(-)